MLLGALRVWNYAKTPTRGVQQLEVYLDESLVWKVGWAGAPPVRAGAGLGREHVWKMPWHLGLPAPASQPGQRAQHGCSAAG